MFWKKKKYLVDRWTLKDGRIVVLCEAGFVDGELIIPVKRDQYGNKNLSLLLKFKNLKIKERKFDTYAEILSVAKKEKAKIITVVEEIKRIASNNDGVIYIDDLFLALMPVYHVGDYIQVYIDKKGRKDDEGIGYLKVGTKVVVDGGGRYVGSRVRVRIEGVVKTDSGQTIFGKVM